MVTMIAIQSRSLHLQGPNTGEAPSGIVWEAVIQWDGSTFINLKFSYRPYWR